MGYDVHITKKQQWFDDEGPEISLEDWTEYVNNNSDMQLDGFAETPLSNGQTLRLESEGLSVWLGYSGHEDEGNKAWFLYSDGNVIVKNPDEEILKKMYHIAQHFGATVQGDECETYDENAQATAPEGETRPVEHPLANGRWWQFWK